VIEIDEADSVFAGATNTLEIIMKFCVKDFDRQCELCYNTATHLIANITVRKTHTEVDVFQAICGRCHKDHEAIFRWVLEPLSGGRPVRGRIPEKGALRK
jgi:hypothetical protein